MVLLILSYRPAAPKSTPVQLVLKSIKANEHLTFDNYALTVAIRLALGIRVNEYNADFATPTYCWEGLDANERCGKRAHSRSY